MSCYTERLRYERYKNTNNILTIDLHNGYTVIAIIGKNGVDSYDIELRLKENTVEKWDLIEEAEHIVVNAPQKELYSNILSVVQNLLQNGTFDYYINRYEYELKCFDIGNEIEENAEAGEVSAS